MTKAKKIVTCIGFIVIYCAIATLALLIPMQIRPFLSGNKLISYTLSQLLAIILATMVVWIFNNKVSKRDFSALGLRANAIAAKFFVRGAAIGFFMITITFLSMLISGGMHLTYRHPPTSVFMTIATLLAIQLLQVLSEEIVFRTYILWKISEEMPEWAVCVVWGVCFGVVHLLGMENNPLAILEITLAGIFLNLSYFLSGRNVWFTIGIHYLWNALQMHVYFSPRLFQITYSDIWWLGGKGDPEAGVIPLAVVALTLLITALVYSRKRAVFDPEN